MKSELGDIEDVWYSRWQRVINLNSRQYDLPGGAVGREFDSELPWELESYSSYGNPVGNPVGIPMGILWGILWEFLWQSCGKSYGNPVGNPMGIPTATLRRPRPPHLVRGFIKHGNKNAKQWIDKI